MAYQKIKVIMSKIAPVNEFIESTKAYFTEIGKSDGPRSPPSSEHDSADKHLKKIFKEMENFDGELEMLLSQIIKKKEIKKNVFSILEVCLMKSKRKCMRSKSIKRNIAQPCQTALPLTNTCEQSSLR